jgi:Na+/H+ antiporter NhaD/arsenite permease-like protein
MDPVFVPSLASFIGTTGASMLLIRPLLHTNAERRRVVHTVVFFIFLVSNIGGCPDAAG